MFDWKKNQNILELCYNYFHKIDTCIRKGSTYHAKFSMILRYLFFCKCNGPLKLHWKSKEDLYTSFKKQMYIGILYNFNWKHHNFSSFIFNNTNYFPVHVISANIYFTMLQNELRKLFQRSCSAAHGEW